MLSLIDCFNPHPPRRAGATRNTIPTGATTQRFNPHPPRRAGATRMSFSCVRAVVVSILTRPEERVQHEDTYIETGGNEVSILTRPEERVQLPALTHCIRPIIVSILTRPEERVQLNNNSEVMMHIRFQSSPAPKSGCNIRFVLFSSIPCLRPHYCEPHL